MRVLVRRRNEVTDQPIELYERCQSVWNSIRFTVMSELDGRRNSFVAGLLLLLLRGVLLWAVVPLAVCVWPFTYMRLRRVRIGFGQFLGWVDLNLMASLSQIVLRPLFRDPVSWVAWKEMPRVTHRVGWLDPA